MVWGMVTKATMKVIEHDWRTLNVLLALAGAIIADTWSRSIGLSIAGIAVFFALRWIFRDMKRYRNEDKQN